MKQLKKTAGDIVASDKFALWAMFIDEAQDELPIAGKISKVAKIWEKSENRLLASKLENALSEIQFLDPVLLMGTVENLQNEYGFKYSDDVFLDAINSANSAEMARLPGKVFRAYCEKEITLEQYWSLLNLTKILIYPDIKCVLNSEEAHVSELDRATQQRLQAAGLAYQVSAYGKNAGEWNLELLNALIQVLNGKKDVVHKVYNSENFPRSISELPEA